MTLQQLSRNVFFTLALGLVPPAVATAAPHAYPSPVFLSKQALSVAQVLVPPPVRGSAADQSDFAVILGYQSTRTPREVARAAFVVDVRLETLFGREWGPLNAEQVTKWAAFFEKTRLDTDYFVQETKTYWGRLRPYFNDTRVVPAVKLETTKAYPSGHAAIARVFARVLTQLEPARQATFEARANQVASDRVLAGVHHPSDIEAGKLLGDQVFEKLMQNPKFITELNQLRPL